MMSMYYARQCAVGINLFFLIVWLSGKKDPSVFLIDCEGVVVDKPVTPDDRKPGKILFIHLIEN